MAVTIKKVVSVRFIQHESVFNAYADGDVRGCCTVGPTLSKCRASMREALKLHLEGSLEDGLQGTVLMSRRSKACQQLLKIMWSEGFREVDDKHFIFRGNGLMVRFEHHDKSMGWVHVSASPISVFDRWANSRHFRFVAHLNRKGRVVLPARDMRDLLRDRFGQIEELVKIIPEDMLNAGLVMEL